MALNRLSNSSRMNRQVEFFVIHHGEVLRFRLLLREAAFLGLVLAPRSETPHLLRLRPLVQIPVPPLHAYGPATGGVGVRVFQGLTAPIFRHHHRLVLQYTLRGSRR